MNVATYSKIATFNKSTRSKLYLEDILVHKYLGKCFAFSIKFTGGPAAPFEISASDKLKGTVT